MAETSITNDEVRAWTDLLNGLPDNTSGAIGADDLRAIVRSVVPRYFVQSVTGFETVWASTAEHPVSVTDAPNYKLLGNGFSITEGAVAFDGHVPMLAQVSLSAALTSSVGSDAVYRLVLSHVNAVERINEPLLSLDVVANAPSDTIRNYPKWGETVIDLRPGSKLLLTRQAIDGEVPDVTVDMTLVVAAQAAVPTEVEVRRGIYGTQNAAADVFSTLPFASLVKFANFGAPSGQVDGQYGFADPSVPITVPLYSPEGPNLRVSVDGAWTALTTALYVGADGPDQSTGANGDFYAQGTLSESEVPVWGPKANGLWPIYPVMVPLLAAP